MFQVVREFSHPYVSESTTIAYVATEKEAQEIVALECQNIREHDLNPDNYTGCCGCYLTNDMTDEVTTYLTDYYVLYTVEYYEVKLTTPQEYKKELEKQEQLDEMVVSDTTEIRNISICAWNSCHNVEPSKKVIISMSLI